MMVRRVNDGFLFIAFIYGITVEAGEPCYTDYYTLEFCDHGCCGTKLPNKYCCDGSTPSVGEIVGYSVGGGLFLIIIIIIIICLCKYSGKKATKTTSYVHQSDDSLPSTSELITEVITGRCDTSFHSHFPGIKQKSHYTLNAKRVGLNSTIIEEALTEDQSKSCINVNVTHTNNRTSYTDTRSNSELVLTPVVTNN